MTNGTLGHRIFISILKLHFSLSLVMGLAAPRVIVDGPVALVVT